MKKEEICLKFALIFRYCGPEVIENMVAYFIGNRFSQEEAIEVHSLLLEQFLSGETELNMLNSYF